MSITTSTDQISLLKAIDGTHLKWNDFREDVLRPFGIKISDGRLLDQLPAPVLSLLQHRLSNLPESRQEGHSWQAQVSSGQGFNANSTIFPPNLLPPISTPSKLQRCLSPKMSREGLPRRARITQDSLFELPHAKPLFASSFLLDAFSESEQRALPNAVLPSATFIDFDHGKVIAGRILACPFLVFEHCPGSKEDDVEMTLNMCALSGAQCVKGIRDMLQTNHATQTTTETAFAFSCAINDNVAVINSHMAEENDQYTMAALCRFELDKSDHFQIFQVWIESIEEWALDKLLPDMKNSLARTSHFKNTPPVSPMPSLTLSIDTLKGSMPTLLRALRTTYPSISWQSDEAVETPIMSSMAACGTPWEGRRLQSLALAPISPGAGPMSIFARRRHTSGSMMPAISTRGPAMYAPARPSPLSPRYVMSPDVDWDSLSPCRPSTLSPCTPAPEMPWTAQAPMLVLRKRVDVAMDEIQELRRQMEALQQDLEAKTKLLQEQTALNAAFEARQKVGRILEIPNPVDNISETPNVNLPASPKSRLERQHFLIVIIAFLVITIVNCGGYDKFSFVIEAVLTSLRQQFTRTTISLLSSKAQSLSINPQTVTVEKLFHSDRRVCGG